MKARILFVGICSTAVLTGGLLAHPSVFKSKVKKLKAIDPIAWSLSPTSGFPDTPVGSQSIVVYTLRNQKVQHPTKVSYG